MQLLVKVIPIDFLGKKCIPFKEKVVSIFVLQYNRHSDVTKRVYKSTKIQYGLQYYAKLTLI